MPFKSEAQRRYLWANEPEIARDWADTYGSRIEKNDGGIMRLGFDNGGEATVFTIPDYGHGKGEFKGTLPNFRKFLNDEEYEEFTGDETELPTLTPNDIELQEFISEGGDNINIGEGYNYNNTAKGEGIMSEIGNKLRGLPGAALGVLSGIPGADLLMQGLRGPQLSQQEKNMNQAYMANYGVTRDQTTGRMIGGPFQGMNAPGMSALGSRTSKEMAQKWMNKYGGVDHQSQEMIDKKAQMASLANQNIGGAIPGGIITPPQGATPAQMNMGSGSQGQHTTQGRDRGRSRGSGDTGQISGGHHFFRGGIAGIWPR